MVFCTLLLRDFVANNAMFIAYLDEPTDNPTGGSMCVIVLLYDAFFC